MYIPTKEQLQGFSLEVANCYGKPHVNAQYLGKTGVDRYMHYPYQPCPFCGKNITNAHHCPPKSKGHGLKIGDRILRPSLIGLCGSGTTGCHGLVHSGKLKIRWVWIDDKFAEKWWSGKVFRWYPPHSENLYEYGYWDFIDLRERERRSLDSHIYF